MKTPWFDRFSIRQIYLITFLLAASVWILIGFIFQWQGIPFVVILAAAGFCLLAAWLAGEQLRLTRERRVLEQRINRSAAYAHEVERRLESVIHLNRQLIEVEDEHSLVEMALHVVSTLTGALASSFVPLDEMGEPLSAIVHGSLPEPILKAWSEHLAGQLVRKTCGKCQELHADAGQVCPLLVGPFAEAFSVYCLPLDRGGRNYGLLNVYFGPRHQIDADTLSFLEGLLQEMGNALQVVRLRGQEFATLRQMQLARANRTDLQAALSDLVENLRISFDMDAAWLRVLSGGERQPEIQIHQGFSEWTETERVRSLFTEVLRESQVCNTHIAGGMVVAAPLTLPDAQVIGAVFLFTKENRPAASYQLGVLQTVAAQAALLIASERARESLEFAIVIQERTRLAREIHDGLAQTLAYLKLQTAQMQRALTQNDIAALQELLTQNYSALSEAYLDARQAIDNLRLNPKHGMIHWLDLAVKEFEHLSGIPVRRTLEPIKTELPSEVQAQLVRIVQEVFNNIRKHSRAQSAWLVLKEWEGDLILDVGDDGQGFFPDDIPGLSQYGLRGMRERADLIGAEFQVVSRPGQGTVMHLRLPARSWEVLQ